MIRYVYDYRVCLWFILCGWGGEIYHRTREATPEERKVLYERTSRKGRS